MFFCGDFVMVFSNSKSILIRLTAFFALAMIFSFPGLATGENPYHETLSVFVHYANAKENPNLEKSPKINLGFDGSNHYVPFVMDTGSVGIIASPDHFTPATGAKNLGPGRQFYSSSGIIEEGTWWSCNSRYLRCKRKKSSYG